MAPLPESSIRSILSTLLSRNPSPAPIPSPTLSNTLSPRTLNIIARTQDLVKRTDSPALGVTPPDNIPNKAVFVLFGLIGAGFVISGIWFFFWAKNGGFYFQENDWDDYKSTVLRRKGPNGTTLSGATASTDLGGGSVVHGGSRWGKRGKNKKNKKEERYKDFDFDDETEYTGGGPESTIGGSEMSEMKEKTRKAKKENKRSKDKKKQPHYAQPSEMSEVSTVIGDEEMDVGMHASHAPHEELRAYRHEKPARVGGLNRQADGSAFDGSTNDGSSAASELLSHREKTPQHTPTRVRKQRKDNYTGGEGTGGIRKVVSTSEGGSSSFWSRGGDDDKKKSKTLLDTSQEQHIKEEAKRLQEKGRAAQRRDFSFRVGDDMTSSTVSGSSGSAAAEDRAARRGERERRRASRSPVKKLAIPGAYGEEGSLVGSLASDESGDIGTKSYHHVIPGLSSVSGGGGNDYADELRKKRKGGYRRGNVDDLDE